jgi:hypothetical protein
MRNGSPNDNFDPDPGYRKVIRAIRDLPQIDPPPGFADGVLRRLSPIRLPWWRRAWIWTRTPRSLAVTPLRIGTIGVGLVSLFLLAVVREGPRVLPGADALRPGFSTVIFQLADPEGRIRSAAVIGSFNRWNPNGFRMRFAPERRAWLLQAQLPPGCHEYVFLLDETRVSPDPEAILTREDGFGNLNSVLLLTEDHEKTI